VPRKCPVNALLHKSRAVLVVSPPSQEPKTVIPNGFVLRPGPNIVPLGGVAA
jgi:hypothetical protein